MVNASLNWTSIFGISMFIYGLATAPMGVAQIVFTLNRRVDQNLASGLKSAIHVIQAIGRFVGLPLFGVIMFFQGWRLDPVLQFGVLILVLGIVFESAPSIAVDYRNFRSSRK
jgi:hypothetical protein